MNEETLVALKGSIKKWEDIRDGREDDLGPRNCPLCQLFFYQSPQCVDCPVKEHTGEDCCRGTPYTVYRSFQDDYRYDHGGLYPRAYNNPETVEKRRRLAQAEVDFLTFLLPKQE